MKNWYFIIDIAKCENCNNCFLACKDEHVGNKWAGYAAPQPNHGHKWINVHSKERGSYPFIDVGYLPVPCMHCDAAPCIKAAKNNAIYKRPDGIVIIDPVKAAGQHTIVSSCPYNAIWWNAELNLPQKCTMCAHLLDDGWNKTRCVQACPTGALTMRQADDNEIQRIMHDEKLDVYLTVLKTRPHVLYKNLYRFTHCFIGGSVATTIDGKEECAEGAEVVVTDVTGKQIGSTMTDNYGDFKIDGLAENSGPYDITIKYQNHEAKTVKVNLIKSLNVGVIKV